jgi:uracil phosphoribosyltransferase
LLKEEEQSEEDAETSYKQFIEAMSENAKLVLQARARDTPERQAEVAGQLAEAEDQARAANAAEVADFFPVLRGLLAREDVTDKIDVLVEPLKQIAEEAKKKISGE